MAGYKPRAREQVTFKQFIRDPFGRRRRRKRRMEAYLAPIYARLELQDEQRASVQNATESVSAFGHELRKLRAEVEKLGSEQLDQNDRLEFIRREIMFEMKYGRTEGSVSTVEPGGGATLKYEIIDQEKVAAARKSDAGLRLNLGCGHVPLSGYINLDMRAVPGVDVVARVDSLPFEPGSVREIHSAHLLEHFPQELLRRKLLPYWLSLLAKGGTFRAVVPDGEAMLIKAADGKYSFEDFREVLFGAQDYDGDFHYNLFTPDSMCMLLGQSGFVGINVIRRGERNGKCYEFEVCAYVAD